MGKIMEEIEERQREKHLQTDEFIGILYWYIKACDEMALEFVKARNDLNEAFNRAIDEWKTKEEQA